MNQYEAEVLKHAIDAKRPLLPWWIIWCSRPPSNAKMVAAGGAGFSLLSVVAYLLR